MDGKSLEWIVSQGIGAVLAMSMFLIYRKDVRTALNSWQGQTKILTDLVREIATTLQGNTSAIQSMERTLPRVCPMVEQIACGGVEIIARKVEHGR